ncbi:hypothetical protein Droror1_Dr00016005 [Drosera rotundifolia]
MQRNLQDNGGGFLGRRQVKTTIDRERIGGIRGEKFGERVDSGGGLGVEGGEREEGRKDEAVRERSGSLGDKGEKKKTIRKEIKPALALVSSPSARCPSPCQTSPTSSTPPPFSPLAATVVKWRSVQFQQPDKDRGNAGAYLQESAAAYHHPEADQEEIEIHIQVFEDRELSP